MNNQSPFKDLAKPVCKFASLSILLLLLCFAFPSFGQIDRGPYLQKVSSNSMTIKWRTVTTTDSRIWYGNSPGVLPNLVQDPGSRTAHEITLSGLTPGTRYYYAAGDASGYLLTPTSNHYFETAPIVGSRTAMRAWIVGDSGTGDGDARSVRDAFYGYLGSDHSDLMLMLGDNAYVGGTDVQYQSAVFSNMYEDILLHSPLMPCPGNHDLRDYSGLGLAAPYFDIFSIPTAAESGGLASGTEHYYSYDFANVHFVSLDSEKSGRNPGDPMLVWLNNDLAATTQDWIVVYFHHPPYTKGSHDSDTEGKLIDMRQNVLPILESWGVDLVLSGHSHSYERSYLVKGHYGSSTTLNNATMVMDGGDGKADGDGVYEKMISGPGAGDGAVYITAGSSGKVQIEGALDHPVHYYTDFSLGSISLEIDGLEMDLKFIDEAGNVDDYFSISKTSASFPVVDLNDPSPAVLSAAAAVSLSATASDPDGSIFSVEFLVNGTVVATDFSAPYTANYTPPGNGTYTVQARATDNDGQNTVSTSKTISVGATPITISNAVSADVEESDAGVVKLVSTDLELVDAPGGVNQTVGLRFTGMAIPQGATIQTAYVQFTTDEAFSGTTNLVLEGEMAANPAFWNEAIAFDVSNRPRTASSQSWSPAPWTVLGEAGPNQATPDLSDVLQEIVDQTAYTTASPIHLVISGTGVRTADAEESGFPAVLHVTYMDVAMAPPTITLNDPSPAVLASPATVTLSATATDVDGSVTSVAFLVDGTLVGTDLTAPYAISWTPAANGTYSIVARATDNDGLQTSSSIKTLVVGSPPISISAAASEDVEENAAGVVKITSTDLELVYAGADGNQAVGLRYTGLAIPQGALIQSASIQFTTDEAFSGTTNLTIQAEELPNPTIWNEAVAFGLSNRPRTSSFKSWSPVPWTVLQEAGPNQRTPDIANVVQEVVNQSAYSSSSAIHFVITGTGVRTAEAEESGFPAILDLVYTDPPSGTPPVLGADFAAVCTGGSISIDVLENDFDLDGSIVPGTVSITTDPGDGPLFGTLSVNAAGTVTYTHNGGPTVVDFFSYTVQDNSGLSDTALVALTVYQNLGLSSFMLTDATSCRPADGKVDIDLVNDRAGSPPYTLLINEVRSLGPFGTEPISINGAWPGAQANTVRITDAAGCTHLETGPFLVGGPSSPKVNSLTVLDAVSCGSNGNIIIDLDDSQPGVAPYLVRVAGTNYSPFSSEPIVISLASGFYGSLRLIDVNGCSTPSAGNFTIADGCLRQANSSLDAAGQTLLTAEVKVFPNPNQGQFTLTFESTFASEVQILLINSLGEVLATQASDAVVGQNIEVLDFGKLESGFYQLQLIMADQLFQKRFVVTD